MNDPLNVVGLEILVRGIDEALPALVDGLGWEVVYRGPSGDVAGERVVLDAGSITVTLLQPAASGDAVLSERTPRVTQIVVGGPPDDVANVDQRLGGLGVPTHDGGPGRRFVPPEVAAGLLGFETALMLQQIVDDADSGQPDG